MQPTRTQCVQHASGSCLCGQIGIARNTCAWVWQTLSPFTWSSVAFSETDLSHYIVSSHHSVHVLQVVVVVATRASLCRQYLSALSLYQEEMAKFVQALEELVAQVVVTLHVSKGVWSKHDRPTVAKCFVWHTLYLSRHAR
jgi:hypothetical protein